MTWKKVWFRLQHIYSRYNTTYTFNFSQNVLSGALTSSMLHYKGSIISPVNVSFKCVAFLSVTTCQTSENIVLYIIYCENVLNNIIFYAILPIIISYLYIYLNIFWSFQIHWLVTDTQQNASLKEELISIPPSAEFSHLTKLTSLALMASFVLCHENSKC